MPVETELYDILEIPTSASSGEIKKAYRKKALKHHPDKGGDVEKFKQINSAYEILSDPDKKSMYDKYGKNGLKNSGAVPDDILSSMFGDFFGGGFNNIFNMYKQARDTIRKEQPTVHTYNASLEDICNRKIIKLRFTRSRVCPCVDGINVNSCVSCKGVGIKTQYKQIAPGMIQQLQTPCSDCSGQGKTYPSCDKCTNGLRQLPKTFQLHLTPELENGYKYIFKNEGNQRHGSDPGDFIVIIKYKNHSFFGVDNNRNLICTQIISLKEALCGHVKRITHPSGEDIIISRDEVTTESHTEVVKGKGLNKMSNLLVKYKIEYPKKLSIDQKTTLRQTLP